MAELVSVIVPTCALRSRAALLRRALESVLSQRAVHAVPLVMVNGTARDEGLVHELSRLPGVRLSICDEADLVRALRSGRMMVDTPWFAELDDDDFLLPGALASRVRRLAERPRAGALVTNGVVRSERPERPVIGDMSAVARDPIAALRQAAWLSPGGALFRTEAVGADLFESLPRYLEWTCLALRLVRAGPIEFVDDTDFVHHEGSPDSLWNSDDCVLGLPAAIRRMLAEAPHELRSTFENRLTSACNCAALLELRRGRWSEAWRWHLQCLAAVGGWRYLGFTRRLLTPTSGAQEAG